MTYTEQGDEIILQMGQEDWAQLLLILGCGVGSARAAGEERRFWTWIDFVNRLNQGNRNYTPYEIPAEYRT